MRDKDGKAMLAVWVGYKAGTFTQHIVAALTRIQAAEFIGTAPECIKRVKGVYATGKPREL